jgi:hypothetical protein
MMRFNLSLFVLLLLALHLAPASTAFGQTCSAFGSTGYGLDSGCYPVPTLTFHVSGGCTNGCGPTANFTGPTKTANGTCQGPCEPRFAVTNQWVPSTNEYYSLAHHAQRRSFPPWDCLRGAPVQSGALCQCPTCPSPDGGTNPANQNTPAEDPLLISIRDTEYRLTSFAQGVSFDLNTDGHAERTAWTTFETDDAFLVLDRNFNGQIDDGMEIFGDRTPQIPSANPNGFRALALFDDSLSGGNEDGRIDANDSIFGSLMLWTDLNHNGRSEPKELRSLEGIIEAIDLSYQRSFGRDEHGHEYRYWAPVERAHGSSGAIMAWNVFFARPTARGPG